MAGYTGLLHRLVPSRFPPTNLFDFARNETDIRILAEIEGITNERLKDAIGQISLVPKHQQRFGPGYSSIMAAFTHTGFASRFTDGTYGVYYAAEELKTSLKEVKFHRHIFYAASNEEPHKATFREYVTRFEAHIRVTAIAIDTHPELLQPTTDYKAPQAFGRQARLDEKWAIQYPSVRHKGGICYAVMRPDALQPARQGSHFEFIWDGQTISDIYALKPENLS